MTAVSRIRLYIEAALPLSVAKQYSKGWDKSLYHDLFGGKYRIYLPLVSSNPSSRYRKTVEQVLNTIGFTVVNYAKGTARKLNPSDTRLFKIGSILNRADQNDLLDKFTRDPARRAAKGDNLEVVISRHPYDVAGMSTNRGWRSCTRIPLNPDEERPELTDQIPIDISAGTLVAYLIDKQDRNINRPIARVLIRRFEGGKSHKTGVYDSVLVPETRVYGTAPTSFLKTVERWCDRINKTAPAGIYDVHPRLTTDSDQRTILKLGPESDWPQIKRYILLNPSKVNEFQKRLSDDQLLDIIRHRRAGGMVNYLTKTRLTGELLRKTFDIEPAVMARRGLVPDDWIREVLEDRPDLIANVKQPTVQDFANVIAWSWYEFSDDNILFWSTKNPAWKRLSAEQITKIMNSVLDKVGLKRILKLKLPKDSRFDEFRAELAGKLTVPLVLKRMAHNDKISTMEVNLLNKTNLMEYMKEHGDIDFLYNMYRYKSSSNIKKILKDLDFQRLAIDINPLRAVNSLSDFLNPGLQMYALHKDPQSFKKMYNPTDRAKIYYLTQFPDYIKRLRESWYDITMLEAAAKGFDKIGKHALAAAIRTALKEGRAGIQVTDDDKVVYNA